MTDQRQPTARKVAAGLETGRDLRAALHAAGPLGRDLLAVDWDATPLGPLEGWSRSLSTAVRILLSSRFSMWMAWGPELTFLCNDAYRTNTLGSKYPWALGRPASQVWAEIWPDIGPRIQQVITHGTATWDEALLLFLERSGYVEETYHTFSYSPLTDDDGTVAGMLCVVSEDTERVIGERQMRTLRDLGSGIAALRTESEIVAVAGRVLAGNPYCLPFTATYLYDDDGTARLAGSTGIRRGHPATPDAIASAPDRPAARRPPAIPSSPGWPAAQLAHGTAVTLDELQRRFGTLPTGAWAEPPEQALLVPLAQQAGAGPFGFLMVGLNRHRRLDEGYRGFVDLIAGQLGAGIARARAYQSERLRAESLAELDRAKTAFFTNISHEFRTPLTLMLGPAEDALDDTAAALPARQRERVDVIHRNAQRLLTLVNTLLDFSRLESGKVSSRFEPVDLAVYTRELAETFRAAIARAGLTLTVDCPPLDRPVYIDREMWAKIVLNLLSNALKFTFEGVIAVGLRQDRTGAELTVTDTGIGIAAQEQARLFERFHRVAGARARSHEGSGIGLALVAELAALHGGTAGVRSAPGRGSTFTVTVPLGSDHLPADQVVTSPTSMPQRPAHRAGEPATDAGVQDAGLHARGFLAEALAWLDPDDGSGDAQEAGHPGGEHPDAPDGPAEPSASTPIAPDPAADPGDRPRILIVDDNADMRGYLSGLLAGGYLIQTAEDGAQALRAAREDPPDLILTDVMMPQLDGIGMLRELRTDPATALIPVVMLSARAGPEAATDGLEAGADDYLIKPFSARELRARVRANLELDRTRRASEELQRSRTLLDQAQRLARVGSWEIDLASGSLSASEEFVRQLGLRAEELHGRGSADRFVQAVHPQDEQRFRAALCDAVRGEGLDVEVRLVTPEGTARTYRMIGELECHPDGAPARLRGSNQDITEQREAERALASAAASREASAREHRIADELQRSLLPPRAFTPDHLDIATYYRAGVEGTQVGGDWFDVIELGADRTALVIGDVMGRGVRAAAVMGQLRAAVRAYARLDLPPADLLELIDVLVRDLGEDQIVTCLYAVYDPGDRTLSYANAGHLPPLLACPGSPQRRLTSAGGPPLGSGPLVLTEERLQLPVGATLTLYTDGLVEHRDSDIDAGIDALAGRLTALTGPLQDAPAALVAALVPGEPDDDIAVLLARVTEHARRTDTAARIIPAHRSAVRGARRFVIDTLGGWGVPRRACDDVVLLVSELVTNAVVHGQPPIELRLQQASTHIVIEVHDSATFLPRKLRPTPDDEHGRGLQLVALLSDRWGSRPTGGGKSVWCLVSTGQAPVADQDRQAAPDHPPAPHSAR